MIWFLDFYIRKYSIWEVLQKNRTTKWPKSVGYWVKHAHSEAVTSLYTDLQNDIRSLAALGQFKHVVTWRCSDNVRVLLFCILFIRLQVKWTRGSAAIQLGQEM